MIVVSILLQAEFGLNDNREDATHFRNKIEHMNSLFMQKLQENGIRLFHSLYDDEMKLLMLSSIFIN